MTFEVSAEAYGRFMGRFSEPLAKELLEMTDVRPPARALDVGCGPGALTAELVEHLGTAAVSAVDPSEAFVAAMRERFPNLDVQRAVAEELPYPAGTFDYVLAQLVVGFMTDPVAGVAEMARVAAPDGLVSASAWDHIGGGSPLGLFWKAALELDPQARSESRQTGAGEGQLEGLFKQAGLRAVEGGKLSVRVGFQSFEDWWEPYTFGVGPAGEYLAALDPSRRQELEAHCRKAIPRAPFEIEATAWVAFARA